MNGANRARSRWAGAALLALAALLGACATPPGTTRTGDLPTASDLTDVDRLVKVRMELAAAYFGRGQASTALDEVKQVLLARPDLPEAYNLRGLIYAEMGQLPLAEESFKRALQINPREASALHNYGWFLCQQRHYDAARVQFEQALAVPQYRDAARTLLAKGICEARAGQMAQAQQTLMKSYELDPSNPTAAFNLSEVLYRRADFERARFYIRRVNDEPQQSNAQTLWLAARIENKLGNRIGVNGIGVLLRQRYPESQQALKFERAQFDE